MKRIWKMTLGVVAATFFGVAAQAVKAAPTCDPGNGGIKLPKGFCALVVAENLGAARHAWVAPNGDLYVALQKTDQSPGGVVALHDSKGDGHFDMKANFGDGSATGIGFYNGYLYVARTDSIVRYKMTPGQLKPAGDPETVVGGFDMARGHNDKGLAFDGKGFLYVNIGSPSNSCQLHQGEKGGPGQDPCPVLDHHSGIWKFDANKMNQTVADGTKLVTGMRQEPGVAWAYGAPYTVMNNRDEIDVLFPQYFTSEDNNEGPAEGMYRIDAGLNFGWPYCFFDYRQKKLLLSPEYGGDGKTQGRCTQFSPPIAAFPAHWAPVDITFYEGKQFPAKYRGGALIAFHGSWNRKPEERPGAVVFQPFVNGKPSGKFEVFADGFSVTPVADQSKYTGRPDGVAVAPDGSLYITDSEKGKVWRVFYKP
jgi:glucose/arabinose dehydrogenase